MEEQFSTPILFLVFNRPEKTKIVFNQIKKIQPLNLFIAADGYRPEKEGEKYKCEQVKAIIKNIDWPCSPRFLFRDKNLGCSVAVKSAIDWFFGETESGIILEDDCLPDQSFFPYCRELLDKYKNDEHVMMISGSNLNVESGLYSYYFSKYGQIWGWATWKRAWSKYETTIQVNTKLIHFNTKKEESFWLRNFNTIIWDVQWAVYTIWKNNGIAILPNSNLITNIGFGRDATYYVDENNNAANLKTKSLEFPLKHPQHIDVNMDIDNKIFQKYYFQSFYKRIINALRVKWILFLSSSH